MKAARPILIASLLIAGCDIDGLVPPEPPAGTILETPVPRQAQAQVQPRPWVQPTPRRTAEGPTAWPTAKPRLEAPTAEDPLAPVAPEAPAEVETPVPTLPAMPLPAVGRPEPLGIFAAGVRQDLAGANQQQQLATFWDGLRPGQQESVVALLETAATDLERMFMLKALIAGEPWENVVDYGTAIRGVDESTLIAKSTMRDDMDLIQQWSDSCGPALLQTIAGETDPRYAWELNALYDVTVIDPYGRNQILAEQQKQWLEQYGGVAVERGAPGGKGIPIGAMLNEHLSPLVSARYDHIEVTDVAATLERVSGILEAGWDVPLRLSWSPPGSAEDSGHFLLAMKAGGAPGARRLLIHDSFTGKTAWVSQSELEADRFGPIFTDYARLTHYYEPTAQP